MFAINLVAFLPNFAWHLSSTWHLGKCCLDRCIRNALQIPRFQCFPSFGGCFCPGRVNAGGGDASVSQRPNASQHRNPQKAKKDALLRTRGLTTPGRATHKLSIARPSTGFSSGGSIFHLWPFPAAPARCTFPRGGCQPAAQLAGRPVSRAATARQLELAQTGARASPGPLAQALSGRLEDKDKAS